MLLLSIEALAVIFAMPVFVLLVSFEVILKSVPLVIIVKLLLPLILLVLLLLFVELLVVPSRV